LLNGGTESAIVRNQFFRGSKSAYLLYGLLQVEEWLFWYVIVNLAHKDGSYEIVSCITNCVL